MITKQFIEKQKVKIERKIKHLEVDLGQAKKFEDIGSTSGDEVLEFEEFEGKNALAKDYSSELIELKKALKRIEDGTYGICEKCKGPIELARLEAFPQSRFCASDK